MIIYLHIINFSQKFLCYFSQMTLTFLEIAVYFTFDSKQSKTTLHRKKEKKFKP